MFFLRQPVHTASKGRFTLHEAEGDQVAAQAGDVLVVFTYDLVDLLLGVLHPRLEVLQDVAQHRLLLLLLFHLPNRHIDMEKNLIPPFVFLLVLSGCAVGPKYARPEAVESKTPVGYTFAMTSPDSITNMKWWDVYQDPELQSLIR